MLFLKQSTASQSVVIGPFVDSTDGNTAETALTVNASDIRLSKNGANIVAKNSGGGTHDELGYYTITLDATDTDTVGRLQVMVHVAGALPVYHEFQVLEEAIFDALFAASANAFTGAAGSTVANANVTQISGDATAADNLEAILDGTGGTGLTLSTLTTSGTVTLNALTVSNATTLTGAVSLGSTLTVTGTTTLAAVACTTITASGAVAFQSTFAVTTSTSLGALSCTTLTASGAVAFQSTFAVTTSTSLAALSATTFATSGTTTLNALTVTNALTVSGATTLTGAVTATNASNNLRLGTFTVDTNAIAWAAAWDAEVQSECADALVAYDGLVPADLPANFAALGINASGHVSRVTLVDTLTTYTSNTPQSGDAFARLGAPAGASVSADVAAVKTDTAAILDDTGTSGVVVAPASKTGYTLSSAGAAAVMTTQMTESYAADGVAPTPAQALFLIQQHLTEFAIVSTTWTTKKLDGSTTAATFTLDSSTTPTSITRAS